MLIVFVSSMVGMLVGAVLVRYAVQKRGSIVSRWWSCALRPRGNLSVAQHALGDLSCLCYCAKRVNGRRVIVSD